MTSFGIGEADRYFYVFTKELGLVTAIAKSVRKLKSKNRYGLQLLSFSEFSFVRGRDIWRIINISPKENLFFALQKDRNKFNFLIKINIFLKKFLQGEEKNENLFIFFVKVIDFLKKNNFQNSDLENFELFVKAKILNNLGYFNPEGQYKIFLSLFDENKDFKEGIREVGLLKKQLLMEISEIFEEIQI